MFGFAVAGAVTLVSSIFIPYPGSHGLLAGGLCAADRTADLRTGGGCGKGIFAQHRCKSCSPDNAKYFVLVVYWLERFEDAEHIVGALRSAGYNSDGIQDSLDEVVAPDKRPDSSLIKTTALARPIVDEVSNLVRAAIPVKAPFVSVFPDDAPLQRGAIQISLF